MGALNDCFEELMADEVCTVSVDSRVDDTSFESKKYIPADYRPVLFAAHSPSSRTGWAGQSNSVIHAQADRDIKLTMVTRKKGDVLCGKKQGKRAFDRYNEDGKQVTCTECLNAIDRFGLKAGTIGTDSDRGD